MKKRCTRKLVGPTLSLTLFAQGTLSFGRDLSRFSRWIGALRAVPSAELDKIVSSSASSSSDSTSPMTVSAKTAHTRLSIPRISDTALHLLAFLAWEAVMTITRACLTVRYGLDALRF